MQYATIEIVLSLLLRVCHESRLQCSQAVERNCDCGAGFASALLLFWCVWSMRDDTLLELLLTLKEKESVFTYDYEYARTRQVEEQSKLLCSSNIPKAPCHMLSSCHRLPPVSEFEHKQFEHENHRITEIGRHSQQLFSPWSLLNTGSAMAGGSRQPVALWNLSGQLVPVFDHPHDKIYFS